MMILAYDILSWNGGVPMSDYAPPYRITDQMMNLVAAISEKVGSISSWQHMNANPRLRRSNRIRTIHASLAIENNTLSLEQVTAIIDGKRVLGAPTEIQEVKNAYDAYEQLLSFDPYSISDLQAAHGVLMRDLVSEAGRFRSGGVGVFKGDRVIHMAPPAHLVPEHMEKLLRWVQETRAHPLIKSCVFHYEFEFIHPFADGNGRMGRMWNTLLLYRWKPLFAWLPVESVIQSRRDAYYEALGMADRQADAAPFVEYMLQAILDSLNAIQYDDPQDMSIDPQMRLLLSKMGDEALSTSELMRRLGLRNRPSFLRNYLHPALEQGFIEMTIPDKPSSRNQQYRRKSFSAADGS